MKKLKLLLAVLLLTFVGFLSSPHAHAAFNPNDVADDSIFDNAGTMNATQIDAFLNSQTSSCISTNNGFTSPDLTGYSPSTNFTYGSDVSAGTVIYHAAQVYGLNPQAILATLEKEQSLVSGSNGCSNLRYSGAMGYGCPDGGTTYTYSGFELYSLHGTPVTSVSGTCVNSSHTVGFSRQVIVATWQFKFDEQRSEGNISWNVQKTNYPNAGNTWDNSDDPQTCYSHRMTEGYRQVCPGGPTNFYDGLTTIDGQTVHADTGATAALYNYTPHFAGNQNFVSIFNNWFGPTIGALMVDTSNSTEYLVDGSTKYPISSLAIASDYGILGPLQFVPASYLSANYPTTGPVLTNIIGDSNNSIYFVTAGIKLWLPTCTMVSDYGGGNCSPTVTLSDQLMNKLFSGPASTQIIKSKSNGTIYYMKNGKKRPIPGWGDLTSLINPISYNILSDATTNSFPNGDLMFGQGSLVKASNSGTVYVVKSPTELYSITSFAYPSELGLTSGLRATGDLSDYSIAGPLQNLVSCGSNYYDGIGGVLYQVTFPSAAATAYAYSNSSGQFIVGDSNGGTLCSALNTASAKPLIQYLKGSDGTIYYVSFNSSSGRSEKQAFTSYTAYTTHQSSDGNPGYIPADAFFLSQIANGANITN